jgi:hypothetical protein
VVQFHRPTHPVVLYSRVAVIVADAVPQANAADRQVLIQATTAGHLSGAALPGYDPVAVKALALASLASGYQWLFLVGAVFMAISTVLTWRLVRTDETPPVSAVVRGAARQAVP